MPYPTKIDSAEMVRLYNAGHTLKEIAEHFKVNPVSVSKAFRKHGLQDRVMQRRMTPERRARIQQLLDEGWSWLEIQNTVGVCWQTLNRHFPGTQWTPRQRAEHAASVRFLNEAISHANYAKKAA